MNTQQIRFPEPLLNNKLWAVLQNLLNANTVVVVVIWRASVGCYWVPAQFVGARAISISSVLVTQLLGVPSVLAHTLEKTVLCNRHETCH